MRLKYSSIDCLSWAFHCSGFVASRFCIVLLLCAWWRYMKIQCQRQMNHNCNFENTNHIFLFQQSSLPAYSKSHFWKQLPLAIQWLLSYTVSSILSKKTRLIKVSQVYHGFSCFLPLCHSGNRTPSLNNLHWCARKVLCSAAWRRIRRASSPHLQPADLDSRNFQTKTRHDPSSWAAQILGPLQNI